MSSVIQIDRNRCVGCGLCAKDCPYQAIRIQNSRAEMLLDSCMECGHCVAICPRNAVSMRGYDMSESIPYNRDTFQLDGKVFLNSLRFRRSVRQFEKRPVEREKIDRIIEAGRYTPTGMNVQNVRYVVMENPAEKIEPYAIQAFSKAVGLLRFAGRFVRLPVNADTLDVRCGFFFHDAPAAIFVISESPVNAALASANMETMAEAQGLGVLFVGLFVRAAEMSRKIRDQLGIRGKEQLVTVLALGYPAVKYQRTVPRKPARVEYR